MRALLRISDRDDVAVALVPLAAGQVVEGLRLRADVPRGHKVALRAMAAGETVLKYGHPIGVATRAIERGEHVHTHNLGSRLTERLAETAAAPGPGPATGRAPEALRFDGYRRADGRVATRNEIWIVPTVGCVNQVAERIAAAARERIGAAVDGLHAFPHPFGCSQLGDDLARTQALLAGLIRHPNAAGVLVVGLGCENNQRDTLLARAGALGEQRVRSFDAQSAGDEIEEGLTHVLELARVAGGARREEISIAELIVGTKCGGSDGFSGITANPLVGRVTDRLTAQGATVLLSEVPEMFGAEQVLLERATSRDVAERTIALANDFRGYFRANGQPIDENPSPGNREGGITTLAEKSLGCVQKAGGAPVSQVVAYGEAATPRLAGVALVESPGNDGVSGTALTAAGAHLILFTTGRGTPMGFPVPTLKIATNSDLASRKPGWIDFDAGPIATGGATFEELEGHLLRLVVDVASGRVRARNETAGFREISIWKTGVTL